MIFVRYLKKKTNKSQAEKRGRGRTNIQCSRISPPSVKYHLQVDEYKITNKREHLEISRTNTMSSYESKPGVQLNNLYEVQITGGRICIREKRNREI